MHFYCKIYFKSGCQNSLFKFGFFMSVYLKGWLLLGMVALTACQPATKPKDNAHKDTTSTPKPLAQLSQNLTQNLPKYHLHIAAAPNVKFALPIIASEFKEDNPNIDITYSFAPSRVILNDVKDYRQRYDIVLADNQVVPFEIATKILNQASKTFTYTQGELVVYSKKYDMTSSPTATFDGLLMDNQPFSVVVGDMENLSYGIATKEWLINQNLYPRIEQNLIVIDNFLQSVEMVNANQADFAIVSLGQVLNDSRELTVKSASQQHSYAVLPKNSYPAIYQDGIVLKQSDASQKFVDYLQSTKAQEILNDAGFLPICQPTSLLPACKEKS